MKRLAELESVYRAEGEQFFLDELAKPTDLAKIQQLQEFAQHADAKSEAIGVLLSLRASADQHGRALKRDDAQAPLAIGAHPR